MYEIAALSVNRIASLKNHSHRQQTGKTERYKHPGRIEFVLKIPYTSGEKKSSFQASS